MIVILLSTALCLAGITPVLAGGKYWSGGWATPTEYEEATGETIEEFSEAPLLKIMVDTEKLPSVEERLPEEPLVVDPVYEIGQYGGDLHKTGHWQFCRFMEDWLITYYPDASKGFGPNFFAGYEVSEEGKVFTFYLRKGAKWSDGVPVTADDFVFFYEDILNNEELNPWNPFPTMEMEVVDDWTVQYRFPEPNIFFLPKLAWSEAWFNTTYLLFAPKHYMKQFHPNYTPADELETALEEEGFDHWFELFAYKFWWIEKDRPTIRAWVMTSERDDMHIVYERNPYYWKVDTKGNQLPYIDRIVYDVVEDPEMEDMKAMAGDIDYQVMYNKANYSLFVENEEAGDYELLLYNSASGTHCSIYFNLACKDPALREIFAKDKFRKALSLAIDREEINELIFNALGIARQASIVKGAAYYDAEWARLYVEYDPVTANAMLDEMGLDQKDGEGWRLRPDGEKLVLVYTHADLGPLYAKTLELVKAYFEEVGCQTIINPVARDLHHERRVANEWELSGWDNMDRLFPTFLLDPIRLIPITSDSTVWGGDEFGNWYMSGGEAGVEPTGDLRKLQEIWDQIKAAADEEEVNRLAQEIIELHKKNIWIIGTVGGVPNQQIVKNGLENVPKEYTTDWMPKNIVPSQFFWKK